MKKLGEIIKWALMIWGALSLVKTLALIVLIGHGLSNFGRGGAEEVGKASPQDVRFVLNDCKLGEARTEKVLHSYVSGRSFTGDHVDAYAIKVRDLTAADLKPPVSDMDGGWLRGDQLPPVFVDAVKMSSAWVGGEKSAWFPAESELLSARYYVWVSRLSLAGRQPISAEIIFANPKTGTVYYSSFKY